MGLLGKKSKTPPSSGSKSKDDEKNAHLQAALDRIQAPTIESMVGAVVHAGGHIEGVRASSQQHSHSQTPTVTIQTRPAGTTTQPHIPERAAGTAASVSQPASGSSTASVEREKNSSGPLNSKELLALGDFLKQQKKQPASTTVSTPVIAPTNPDPDAVISAHIAEKKRVAEQKAADEDANKWHVTQAGISEKMLNKQQMYKYAAYWLGAVPVAFILYAIIGATGADDLRGIGQFLVMAPVYVIGMYGLFGWIPLVLEYLKTQKG